MGGKNWEYSAINCLHYQGSTIVLLRVSMECKWILQLQTTIKKIKSHRVCVRESSSSSLSMLSNSLFCVQASWAGLPGWVSAYWWEIYISTFNNSKRMERKLNSDISKMQCALYFSLIKVKKQECKKYTREHDRDHPSQKVLKNPLLGADCFEKWTCNLEVFDLKWSKLINQKFVPVCHFL